MKILLQIYYGITHYIEELFYYLVKRDRLNQKNLIRWGKFCLHRIDVLKQITLLDRDRIDNKLSRLKREGGV